MDTINCHVEMELVFWRSENEILRHLSDVDTTEIFGLCRKILKSTSLSRVDDNSAEYFLYAMTCIPESVFENEVVQTNRYDLSFICTCFLGDVNVFFKSRMTAQTPSAAWKILDALIDRKAAKGRNRGTISLYQITIENIYSIFDESVDPFVLRVSASLLWAILENFEALESLPIKEEAIRQKLALLRRGKDLRFGENFLTLIDNRCHRTP
jgi:hypothetical protein